MNDQSAVPSPEQIVALTNQLNVSLTADQVQKIIDFMRCLHKWNGVYNLSAIRTYDKMLSHHIADSLSIASFVSGQRILDVGTGAGLPGIPLAILYPDKQFVLLDSVGKKIRFLHEVKRLLSLDNVELVNTRVESFSTESLFDIITARAVSSLADMVENSQHLLKSSGCFLLQKGLWPHDELVDIKDPYKVIEVKVPLLDAKRHLVMIGQGVKHG
jgi:16S rRNA (guanine527-N7)-methyltransferase